MIDEVDKEPLNHKRVHYIQGNAMKKEVLEKANLTHSSGTIVFATDCSDNSRLVDENTLLVSAALEKNAPHVHTTVEVLERDHVPMFEHSAIDEVVLSDEFVSRMLVRSSFQKGISNVFNQLISRSVGQDLREIEKKSTWTTYGDAVEEITSKGATLIAVGDDMDIYQNLSKPLPASENLRIICDKATYTSLSS